MLTLFTILALMIALAALAYALKLQQELGTVTRRLDRYNRALFDAKDELRGLRTDMERTAAELRVAIMRGDNGFHFTPETTVQEAELMHPQVAQVLAGFHMGGCDDCAVAPGDTLAQVCAARNLPVETLLANLNLLVEADDPTTGANGKAGGAPVLVRIPNVVLEFE